MTGNKRSHRSRSKSRSPSPSKTRLHDTRKSSSEDDEPCEKVEHKRSSSSDKHVSGRSKECSKSKKIRRKSRNSSASSESSVGSQNDSLCSSRTSSHSKAKERKKLKKLERKKQKKEKKLKKKHKKEKQKLKKVSAVSATNTEKTVDAKPEVLQNKEPADQQLTDRAKAMAPMTKEEWEKRQSVVRRVYDEETGRHRLIKGDGEILEEIVSRERHCEINRQATKGDGTFFQSTMAAKLKK